MSEFLLPTSNSAARQRFLSVARYDGFEFGTRWFCRRNFAKLLLSCSMRVPSDGSPARKRQRILPIQAYCPFFLTERESSSKKSSSAIIHQAILSNFVDPSIADLAAAFNSCILEVSSNCGSGPSNSTSNLKYLLFRPLLR